MGLKSKPLQAVRPLSEVTLAEVAREDLVRININVSKDIRKQWKSAALRADKTLTDLIQEAMDAYLK